MSKGWGKAKLKDIADVIMGQSPKSEFYNEYGKGLPFFQGRAEFGYLYPEVKKWCTKPTKIAMRDDVLMTVRAPVGDLNIAKEECIIGRGICALRSKIKNDRFLFYLLKGNNSYITSFGSGAVYDAINKDSVEQLTFNLPDEISQKKISNILSTYDDLIENNTRRIRILEEIARRIYKEWFVDFRFPGHKKVKFIDSEMGKIPEGWKIVKLENIIENVRETTKPGNHLADRKYVPIDCIPRKSFLLRESLNYKEAKSSLILFDKRDILFGNMRSYFHKVVIAPFDGITRTTCFVLRVKFQDYFAYSYLTLFDERTVSYSAQHSKGATIPYAFWDGGLANLKIIKPSQEISIQFNEIVNPTLNFILNSYYAQSNLVNTRDILLPRLISGEIDVSEMDIAIREQENSS